MDQTRLAWAAGIVDADGCIAIQRHTHTRTGKSGLSFTMYVSVSNNIPEMLVELQSLFGGGISDAAKQKSTTAHWRWEVSCKKAETMLRRILPYLIAKKNQAEVALSSREFVRRGRTGSDKVALFGAYKELKNLKHLRISRGAIPRGTLCP